MNLEPDGMERAAKAKERSQLGFFAAASRQKEVEDLTSRARARVNRNHFGEGIEAAWRLGRLGR